MSKRSKVSKPNRKPKPNSSQSGHNPRNLGLNAINEPQLGPGNDETAEVWQCPHLKRHEVTTHRRNTLVFVVIFLVIGILASIVGVGVTFAVTEKLRNKMLQIKTLDLKWNNLPFVFAFLDFVSSIWIGCGSAVLGAVTYLFR
jgi:hypothetical protein